MSKIHYINPEVAAHNVANAFVEKYILSLNDKDVFDFDGTLSMKSITDAAQIYACAYDTAFDAIFKENSEIDEC